MKEFRTDLKTFLSLAMTNQYSQTEYQTGFWVIIWGQNSLIFIIPIYSTTELYWIIIAQSKVMIVQFWNELI